LWCNIYTDIVSWISIKKTFIGLINSNIINREFDAVWLCCW
jgi:hypothetical protein